MIRTGLKRLNNEDGSMPKPDLKQRALATKVPFDTGPIHFVGIGGIGMSGIAEVMLNLGYQVQGSDGRSSVITKRLQKLGATIYLGQKAEQVNGAGAIVMSSAIKADKYAALKCLPN